MIFDTAASQKMIRLLLFTIFCLNISISLVKGFPNFPSPKQAVSLCLNHASCAPEELANQNISLSLVECASDGQCICHDCFTLDSTINRCSLNPPCTNYDNYTHNCIDNRRSQLMAFLLASFLTISGAANFYIDRLEYAIPQLFIGITFTVLACLAHCLKVALEENENQKLIFISWSVMGILLVIFGLMLASWWLADLILFGTNKQVDGNGCQLIANL